MLCGPVRPHVRALLQLEWKAVVLVLAWEKVPRLLIEASGPCVGHTLLLSEWYGRLASLFDDVFPLFIFSAGSRSICSLGEAAYQLYWSGTHHFCRYGAEFIFSNCFSMFFKSWKPLLVGVPWENISFFPCLQEFFLFEVWSSIFWLILYDVWLDMPLKFCLLLLNCLLSLVL